MQMSICLCYSLVSKMLKFHQSIHSLSEVCNVNKVDEICMNCTIVTLTEITAASAECDLTALSKIDPPHKIPDTYRLVLSDAVCFLGENRDAVAVANISSIDGFSTHLAFFFLVRFFLAGKGRSGAADTEHVGAGNGVNDTGVITFILVGKDVRTCGLGIILLPN